MTLTLTQIDQKSNRSIHNDLPESWYYQGKWWKQTLYKIMCARRVKIEFFSNYIENEKNIAKNYFFYSWHTVLRLLQNSRCNNFTCWPSGNPRNLHARYYGNRSGQVQTLGEEINGSVDIFIIKYTAVTEIFLQGVFRSKITDSPLIDIAIVVIFVKNPEWNTIYR